MSFSPPASAPVGGSPGGGVRGLRHPVPALLAILLGAAVLLPAASATGPVGVSIVAQARGARVAVFRSPEAKQPFRVLANPNADGSQLVFLVRRRIPGWTQVSLPIRPNGSRGWVRTRSVALSLDPYRITISLGKHQITLWKGSRMVVRERAGVGRTVLPTPRGVYYIAELLKQPDPGGAYGPYAFGLSAHSNVLYSFGGGAGQIGIHGTNEPDLLGTDVSHGCIRVANSLIIRLARILPLGTPVAIDL